MSFLLLLFIMIGSTASSELYSDKADWISYIKCPLIWETGSTGEPVPAGSVPAAKYGVDNFIARVERNSGMYVLGRLFEGQVYSFHNQSVFTDVTYDVLTNPHGCTISWTKGPSIPPFTISNVEGGTGSYVGRAVFNDVQLSGSISSGVLYVIGLDGLMKTTTAFESLQSYTKGLSLQVTQFKFENDIFSGSQDMLGLDTIINTADTKVSQVVVHRKKISESTEISSLDTWGHTFSVDFNIEQQVSADIEGEEIGKVGISLPPINLSYTTEYPKGKSTSFYNQRNSDMEAIREITVPPYTSVQFCSTVKVVNNFRLAYTASGKYSSPGLTAAQVSEILAKDGLRGTEEGNSVLVERKGTFQGSMAMANQFIVAPVDAPEGCSQLATKIAELKRETAFGRLTQKEIEDKNREIDAIIKRNGKRL